MKLLYTLLLAFFISCSTEPEDKEWICTTDGDGIPLPEIFNSLVECESVCPNEMLEVTTPDFPNGTGMFYVMYCSENE